MLARMELIKKINTKTKYRQQWITAGEAEVYHKVELPACHQSPCLEKKAYEEETNMEDFLATHITTIYDI